MKIIGIILATVISFAFVFFGMAGTAQCAMRPPDQDLSDLQPASPVPTACPTAEPIPTPAPSAAPETTTPPIQVKTITMAQLAAQQKDRIFDYSYTFRMVKRGNVAYYVRFNVLYIFQGGKPVELLDDADFNWMYIDEKQNLWFGIKGAVDISSGKIVDREYLYKYDRSAHQFALIKKENDHCSFSNRFCRSCFFYLESGNLKALNTNDGTVRVIGAAKSSSIIIGADERTVYYENAYGRQIMLTGFGNKREKLQKTTLKLKDFPLGFYTFDNYVIYSTTEVFTIYKFEKTGYRKLCDVVPDPSWQYNYAMPFYVTSAGLYVLREHDQSVRLDFYSFAARQWSKVGVGEQYEQYSCSGSESWFYSYASPITLSVIINEKDMVYDFGSLIDSCTDIQILGNKAYLYQYDQCWLAYVFDMGTNTLFEVKD